jgi:hypothetical protein
MNLTSTRPNQPQTKDNATKTGFKVLFLDIDGVVNKRENYDPSRKSGPYPIDTYCAFLVGRIKLQTGCEVVLSSSWRHHPEGVENVSDRVVELLSVTPTLSGLRGDEVQAWLDIHPEVEKYAIVDDDLDFYVYQAPNFFLTTFQDGLTDEIAEAIIEHLK